MNPHHYHFIPLARGACPALHRLCGGLVTGFLLLGCLFSNALAVKESWQSSPTGTYIPQEDALVQIPGDIGPWLVADTASNFPEGGPTPNKAEILSSGSDRYLKLTSAPGTPGMAENIWVVRHHLYHPLSIPLASGKMIAISQTGNLDDPYWGGWHPGGGSPNGTSVHMMIEDNRGNRLVYLFQRAADYPAHSQTLQGYDTSGNLVSFGYHEILLGATDAAGGIHVRNVFNDFSQVPEFNPAGASINQISYEITGPGTTILRLLEIDEDLSPIPPTVGTLPATDVTTTTATLNGTVNPNGSATTARFEYGPTAAYGSTVNVALSPDDGTTAQSLSVPIGGLLGGTTYHFRLSATNSADTTPGGDMIFDTPSPPIDPGELGAPEIALGGGEVRLTIQSTVPGRRYQLQESATLQPGSWIDVGSEQLGDGQDLPITIPLGEPAAGRNFYRVILDPVAGLVTVSR